MDDRSDEEIASAVQGGDAESFALLIERYEAKMMRYANKFFLNKVDTEDAVQDIFLKAYANIRSFDAKRRFSPWLYRIAHNEFINVIKKKSREPLSFFSFDSLLPHLSSEDNADDGAVKREVLDALNRSLNKLSVLYREPLILRYFEDMSYQEIAEVLKVPVSTVGIRLRRGQQILKESMV
ncbi:MAG: RNA polymerase sigma factor [Candidatus Jorgensenbacteria bacterium]